MDYQRILELDVPYDEAVTRVREALAEQGFGILTEIDVKATLKQKLDADIEDYVILGACNPPLAHRALEIDRSVGVLLPCNVVVGAKGNGSIVRVLDPMMMASVTGLDELGPVADEAATRLQAALDALGAG